MEQKKKTVQPVITGTFNAEAFYGTLAKIFSNKFNLDITAHVTKSGDGQQKETV